VAAGHARIVGIPSTSFSVIRSFTSSSQFYVVSASSFFA
jgi:hypothetical protein